MSSLFSKLMALVSAGARGPRRSRRKSRPPAETDPSAAGVPEVAEVSSHQRDVPEVSEAVDAGSVARRVTIPSSSAASRKAVSTELELVDDGLEEERVVDLLQDKDS